MIKLIEEYKGRIKGLELSINSITTVIKAVRRSKAYEMTADYLAETEPLVKERAVADAKRMLLVQVIKDIERVICD